VPRCSCRSLVCCVCGHVRSYRDIESGQWIERRDSRLGEVKALDAGSCEMMSSASCRPAVQVWREVAVEAGQSCKQPRPVTWGLLDDHELVFLLEVGTAQLTDFGDEARTSIGEGSSKFVRPI